MKTIKVGTRGSKLARIQTAGVTAQLLKEYPGFSFETVVIRSLGDRVQDRPLTELGGNGVFTSELERALLAGEIDLAVHSMKDLPSCLPAELCLADSPRRADPRDALVLAPPYAGLDDLPPGARIGTGSIRRTLCLAALRPDLQAVPIRGNIDTRLAMVGGGLDGVILAAAGLIRAGYGDRISQFFPTEEFVPAPAQGILALELRRDDTELLAMLNRIGDRETVIAVRAERAFLKAAGVGCHAPVGAFCRVRGEQITLTGLYGADAARRFVTGAAEGCAGDAEKLGRALAETLITRYEETCR